MNDDVDFNNEWNIGSVNVIWSYSESDEEVCLSSLQQDCRCLINRIIFIYSLNLINNEIKFKTRENKMKI